MSRYWCCSVLTLISVFHSVQHICAVGQSSSDSLPTELFKPVEAAKETPIVLNKVPSQSQQQRPQSQTQPHRHQVQFTYPTNVQTFTYTPNNRNDQFQSNPFLPRPSQIINRDNSVDSNEFSFENNGNRVGTTYFQSSIPNSNANFWISSSGSSPEIRAQLEAAVKKRLEEVQQQFQQGGHSNGHQITSSFRQLPGSGSFYREKSFQTSYDSNGTPITTHYEYDSRNGARSYVTYD